MNRFDWDRRYPGARRVKGMVLWGAYLGGPNALPGRYKARLNVGKKSTETTFVIRKDPRTGASTEDLQAQFEFIAIIRDKLTETHDAILRIRDIRTQVSATLKKASQSESDADKAPFKTMGKDLKKRVTAIEEALYQTKSKSPQDPLNFPIRLNNKLGVVAGTASRGDYQPTDQAREVAKVLTAAIDGELGKLRDLEANELKTFNDLATKLKVRHVAPKAGK